MPSRRGRILGAAAALAVVLCTAACSPGSDPSGQAGPSAATARCASGPAAASPAPLGAEPVDGGTPPPPPVRVEVRAGPRAGTATVRVVAAAGVAFESSELRVFVDGCRVPWTDEGDQLPTQTVDGLHAGDRLEVLARLNGEGGNSAETASAVLTVP